MGKIGKQRKEKRENDPVYDGRSAADEKINDLFPIFRQMERLEHDIDGLVDEADEKAAAVAVHRIVIQERYVLSR